MYYTLDYVDTSKMLVGGAITIDLKSYPYFEMHYFTGKSEDTSYITDSSLVSIRSIFHSTETTFQVVRMLFEHAPMKVGVYKTN